jgi:hypothetical protein
LYRYAAPEQAMMAEIGMADDELRMLALAHRDVARTPPSLPPLSSPVPAPPHPVQIHCKYKLEGQLKRGAFASLQRVN